MIIYEVVPKPILIGTLLLSSEYYAIPNAQWQAPPLPVICETDYRLYTPKPDLTIDHKQTDPRCNLAISDLAPSPRQ